MRRQARRKGCGAAVAARDEIVLPRKRGCSLRVVSLLVRSLRYRRMALRAAVILGSASLVASAHAGATQPLSPNLVRYWTAVAACETGGGGPPKWDWGS